MPGTEPADLKGSPRQVARPIQYWSGSSSPRFWTATHTGFSLKSKCALRQSRMLRERCRGRAFALATPAASFLCMLVSFQ